MLGMVSGTFAQSSERVRSKEFSLSRGALALKGFDPVSYFRSGPQKGSKQFSYIYGGVQYHFISEKNLDAFKKSPHAFEPEYGGWCAWAMYDDGGRTEPNPSSFRIVDGKLYLFYDGLFGDTLKLWNDRTKKEEEIDMIRIADDYWSAQVDK